MTTRIGINGFGRIGRNSLKAILSDYPGDIEIAAINDLTDAKTNAHLLKYDTTYGQFPGSVEAADHALVINGRTIQVTSERDPARIPWADLGVQIVIESTGHFTDAVQAAAHLNAGAKKVLISAPAKGDDVTLVPGVNEAMYDPTAHHIISTGSCTTHCVALTAKVLYDAFGIEQGLMNTVHAFTNDQRLHDQAHSDLRRARAVHGNIIPTTTGAARAVFKVIPGLKGKFDGLSLRVPTATVSVADLVVTTREPVTAESANAAFQAAAEGPLKGILGYTDEPLVSQDFRGDTRSAILDGLSTMALGNHFLKVLSWYDNEWAFSHRVADLTLFLIRRGL